MSIASGGEHDGRVLTDEDIGRVFVRVDPNGDPEEYLRLSSMGAHPNQIASFISFRVTDGAARDVQSTGFLNAAWYREVRDLPESLIADVVARHEKWVEALQADLREAEEVREQHDRRLLSRFGKPKKWVPMGDGPTEGKLSREYVVWYDPGPSRYVIEIYGASDQLLANGTVDASYEPRFGMDAIDSETIFGETGQLSRLIALAERKQR